MTTKTNDQEVGAAVPDEVPAHLFVNGVGYAGDRNAIVAALDQYQASGDVPPDLEARTVAASRKIDALHFKADGEDRVELQRYADGDMVPTRISYAAALIGIALPAGGVPVPLPVRQPEEIAAASARVKFGSSTEDLQPSKSDDQILAERLGIPDVRAFRLLRPYLVLPDTLNQDSRERGPAVNVNIEFSPDIHINADSLIPSP